MGGRSGGTFVDDGSDSDLVASCVGSARDEFGGTTRRVGVERGTGRRSDGAGARAHRDPCLVFRNLTGSAKRTKSRKFRGAFVEQVAHRDFLSAGVFRARDIFVGASNGIRIEGGRGHRSQTPLAPFQFRPRRRSGDGSGSEGRSFALGGVVFSASIHLQFLSHFVAPTIVPAQISGHPPKNSSTGLVGLAVGTMLPSNHPNAIHPNSPFLLPGSCKGMPQKALYGYLLHRYAYPSFLDTSSPGP
mmetsp:Transcript_9567/g.20275  ORF Transcript_9567/g.20275 Transcript_9567/m.20275 type:complete len:245 (+) Transcript_9567:839-1573(+)